MADVELNSIGNGDGTNYLVRDNTKIPLSGSNQISGSLIPATDNSVNLGDSTYGFASFYTNKIYLKGNTIFNVVDDNYICVGGATAQANGANLTLNGKNRSTSKGEFKLEARDGTYTKQLIGKPNGTLSWGPKNVAMQEDVVPRSGGAVISGNTLGRIDDTNLLFLNSGSDENNGGHIVLFGASYGWAGGRGTVRLNPALSSTTNKFMYLHPDGTWTWEGQPIQYTSDQRYKQQISEIDDDLLTAWEDVEPVQFKYNDAVKEKSDNARLHTGYVVQQIDDACKSHGVDVSKYGLYCHEEYPEETREVEQADGTKKTEVVRPASEHYSLRYTEALIVECAYLRKKNKDLQEQLNTLSERLEKLENR